MTSGVFQCGCDWFNVSSCMCTYNMYNTHEVNCGFRFFSYHHRQFASCFEPWWVIHRLLWVSLSVSWLVGWLLLASRIPLSLCAHRVDGLSGEVFLSRPLYSIRCLLSDMEASATSCPLYLSTSWVGAFFRQCLLFLVYILSVGSPTIFDPLSPCRRLVLHDPVNPAIYMTTCPPPTQCGFLNRHIFPPLPVS